MNNFYSTVKGIYHMRVKGGEETIKHMKWIHFISKFLDRWYISPLKLGLSLLCSSLIIYIVWRSSSLILAIVAIRCASRTVSDNDSQFLSRYSSTRVHLHSNL
jgi:hypothetical protein